MFCVDDDVVGVLFIGNGRGVVMIEVYVIDVVWIVVGKWGGVLVGIYFVDLGVLVWCGLLDWIDIDFVVVDDVIVGCVDVIGGQVGNIV